MCTYAELLQAEIHGFPHVAKTLEILHEAGRSTRTGSSAFSRRNLSAEIFQGKNTDRIQVMFGKKTRAPSVDLSCFIPSDSNKSGSLRFSASGIPYLHVTGVVWSPSGHDCATIGSSEEASN